MAAFALGGLVVAGGGGLLTYELTRRYLLDQRQTSGISQGRANALLARAVLSVEGADVTAFLGSLETPSSSRSLVFKAGDWFATTAATGPDTLPADLRRLVIDEHLPARQRFVSDGSLVFAVGFPLSADEAYFEVFPLSELETTLGTLRAVLAGAATAAFFLSLAIGRWTTRRALQPLDDIGRAAATIAGGDLEARLDGGDDVELTALARGFNTMVESLQHRIERDARFASDVSHELRSPLTTMRSAVETMLRRRVDLDPRSQRALDLLAAEVDRFEQMVEDLLEISRADAGAVALEWGGVELGSLVRTVLAAESQPDAAVEAAPPTVTVIADRRRLEQALRNLVSNAVAYGGGVSRVTISATDGAVQVGVEDRGPGIPPSERDEVFDRFARGRGAGRRASGRGVGLGLALVREHVTVQGGRVWIEDAPGGGARFVLELPLQVTR
jgi:signal transduction histidine kinase